MDNDKTIKGVSCEVETCEYHTRGNECAAGTIKVEPYDTTSKEEADCATFKKKF